MNKWEFARRDVLKQLGVGLACLPVLHHSRKALADSTVPGPKLAIIHASEGYRHAFWEPALGPLETTKKSIVPLTPHKDKLIFLTHMKNPNYKGGFNFGHEAYTSIFWGGTGLAGSGKYLHPATGLTLDQHIASALPKKRETLAFQIQLDKKPDQANFGGKRCFWKAGQSINPEFNPQETYARLFGGLPAAPANPGMPVDDTKSKQLIFQKKSILDYVGKSLEKFKVRVAREDQAAVDGHLTSIRELENTLVDMAGSRPGAGGAGGGKCGVIDPGVFSKERIMAADAHDLYPKIMDAYFNMMIAGLACDITDVATIQIADSTGNQINFGAFLGDRGIPPRNSTNYKSPFRNWHDLGHNPISGGVDHHQIVDHWCMEKFAGFIDKFKAVTQPGGSMLDNGLVLWSNHMDDGNTHLSQEIPWMLAGNVKGKLNTGIHANSRESNIMDAMADICFAMGVPQTAPFTGGVPGVRKA